MKRLFIAALFMLLLPTFPKAQVVEKKVSWKTLNERGYPQWFSDARLGIFVHWGLYSVPAYASKEGYAEWFYRGLMLKDSGRCQIMSLYADTTLPVFEQYKTLTNYWHAELWNPAEWARLFKEAGAGYVVLVTKHHDGYCLWDSPQQPEWNSVASGPRRNIVEELTKAVRREGLRMGFYYSLPEWSNPRHIWMEDPDNKIGDYVDNYMVPQFKELVSRYRPSLIFADGDWQNTAEQFRSEELIDWYYNTVGADAIVNDRWGNGTQHGFKTPEYSAGINVTGRPWAECRGLGRSFGYNRNEDLDNYLTDGELIRHFCELVANGGGLTLNVGPYADGTIPLIQQERLRALGRWLEVNGEAIYGSEPPSDRSRCERVKAIGLFRQGNAMMPETESIDYDWVRNAPLKNMPVDDFTIMWQGTVVAPSDGNYTFKVEGNDEIMVVCDGKDTMLYYNSSWAENDRAQKTLRLKKGKRLNFEVFFHEKELEASASLKWSFNGGAFVPVPAKWQGTARWRQWKYNVTRRGDAEYYILYERPELSYTIEDLPPLSPDAVVTLLGTTGTLQWKQDEGGNVTIDFSTVNPSEFNALNHAWVVKISGLWKD